MFLASAHNSEENGSEIVAVLWVEALGTGYFFKLTIELGSAVLALLPCPSRNPPFRVASLQSWSLTKAAQIFCNLMGLTDSQQFVHTFSAFWLWSSVVSVLISVTTDMSPTGDLLVTFIFDWGDVLLSLLGGSHVLHWHCTKLGAAHP